MYCSVRSVRPADRDPLWRVHDRALRASALRYDPEYNRYLRHAERAFLDAGGEFLVGTVPPTSLDGDHDDLAVDDRRLIAIGGYQPLSALSAADQPPGDGSDEGTVRIRSVAVLPACQGQGVGADLVERLESTARRAGYDRVVLASVAEMADARAFWRAMGYERIGELPVSDADSVWFERQL